MEIEFKICGLTRPEDAWAAEEAGATFGGVVLAPSGPRSLSLERAAEVLAGTSLRRSGVFVDEPLGALLRSARALRLDVVQLHGDESPALAKAVRASGFLVWKAVRPRSGAEFVEAAEYYAEVVDGLLLDGWSPLARGGTGTRFPWEDVARHRTSLDPSIRLIAAGGLNAVNVAEILSVLAPDVVDVSSGVETSPGLKDVELIRGFATAVRSAAARGGTR